MKRNTLDSLQSGFEFVLRSPAVPKAFAANTSGMERFRSMWRFQEAVLKADYRSSVIMPGLIVNTNAPAIEGSTARWKDFIGYCYIADYEMWVESSVTNWWAVILTGALVLCVTALFMLWVLRTRRRS